MGDTTMPARFSVASDGQPVNVVTTATAYKKELARLNREYLKALALRNGLRKRLAAAETRLQAAKKAVNLLLEDAAAAGQGAGELPTGDGT